MNYEKIDFKIDGPVARIVFNDVINHNVVGAQFSQELARAAIECEAQEGLKVVVLTAAGTEFSVGGDLNEFLEQKHRLQAHIREMATYFHLAISVLNRLEATVLCGVNGIAAGGGVSLAIMADLTIAVRSAKFNLAYTRSGLTPDGGSTWFLPRLVGPQRAFDIMATNPSLSADEAHDLGLIARVVDDNELEQTLEDITASLLAAPANAVARGKRLLRKSLTNSLEQQLELESKSIARNAADAETLAALEAFFETRQRNKQ